MKMLQEGQQEGGGGTSLLAALFPRLVGGTLTPRLDCMSALEEGAGITQMLLCMFPRVNALLGKQPSGGGGGEGGEGGEQTAVSKTRLVRAGSPKKAVTSRVVKVGSPGKAAVRNFSVKVQSPPKQQGDDFKSVLKSFGIRV
ncbi:MAG TPA: hypothetical protein ENF26_05530 [Methanomicrobia archaeon]|nr:hypothetical protein [Methanomicrobia archaeon]HEX59589.1 hypothetical protein [Methanomicrobia archaeon]